MVRAASRSSSSLPPGRGVAAALAVLALTVVASERPASADDGLAPERARALAFVEAKAGENVDAVAAAIATTFQDEVVPAARGKLDGAAKAWAGRAGAAAAGKVVASWKTKLAGWDRARLDAFARKTKKSAGLPFFGEPVLEPVEVAAIAGLPKRHLPGLALRWVRSGILAHGVLVAVERNTGRTFSASSFDDLAPHVAPVAGKEAAVEVFHLLGTLLSNAGIAQGDPSVTTAADGAITVSHVNELRRDGASHGRPGVVASFREEWVMKVDAAGRVAAFDYEATSGPGRATPGRKDASPEDAPPVATPRARPR